SPAATRLPGRPRRAPHPTGPGSVLMPASALNRRWDARLWTVLVVIALATLAAGAAYVRSGEARLIASAGESLTLAAASIAKELDLLISERYGNIETLAQAVVSRRGDSSAMR